MQQRLVALSLLLLAVPALAEVCNTDEIAPSTPTSRFTDTGNGNVTDTVTGLIWKVCVQGQQWQQNATTGKSECLNYGIPYSWRESLQQPGVEGTGWRLPNIKELATLVEHQCYGPAINGEVFPNAPTGYADTLSLGYWSSTPFTLDVGQKDELGRPQYTEAWYLDAFRGIGYHAPKTYQNYVRLVRDTP